MESVCFFQTGCLFLLAVFSIVLTRRYIVKLNQLNQIQSQLIEVKARQEALFNEKQVIQQQLAAAQEKCSQIENSQQDELIRLREAFASYQNKMTSLKAVFSELQQNERASLDANSRLIVLRQRRTVLLQEIELLTNEDKHQNSIIAELIDVDEELKHYLDVSQHLACTTRHNYTQLMQHHSEMLGHDYSFEEMVWIKMQAEKAYAQAMELIGQLNQQLEDLNRRRKCYESSMERLKMGVKRISELTDCKLSSSVVGLEPTSHQMQNYTDNKLIDVNDEVAVRSALRQPSIPKELFGRASDDDLADVSRESFDEIMIRLMGSLERASLFPPEAPLVIDDWRSLAIICRFLLRRVEIGQELVKKLAGRNQFGAQQITVGKLAWIAPYHKDIPHSLVS